MAERTIAPTTYVIICVLMVAATIISISISFIPMAGAWHATIGLLFGLFKATLVALFFMHVLLSTRLTWTVIIVAIFWVGVLFVLTFGDYMTRYWVPHMPPH
jgi:cytochrome c oxidase subunit 4